MRSWSHREPLPAGKVEVDDRLHRRSPRRRQGVSAGRRRSAAARARHGADVHQRPEGRRDEILASSAVSARSITETFDVGKDTGSPVSAAYAAPNAFTGTVEKVTIDLIK